MRRAAKVDDNQAEIVAAFRALGVSVQPMHQVGAGFPDLLCAYMGRLFLVEVKDGNKPPSKRKLTKAQEKWHQEWPVFVYVVDSVEVAKFLVGEFKEDWS